MMTSTTRRVSRGGADGTRPRASSAPAVVRTRSEAKIEVLRSSDTPSIVGRYPNASPPSPRMTNPAETQRSLCPPLSAGNRKSTNAPNNLASPDAASTPDCVFGARIANRTSSTLNMTTVHATISAATAPDSSTVRSRNALNVLSVRGRTLLSKEPRPGLFRSLRITSCDTKSISPFGVRRRTSAEGSTASARTKIETNRGLAWYPRRRQVELSAPADQRQECPRSRWMRQVHLPGRNSQRFCPALVPVAIVALQGKVLVKGLVSD